MERFVDVGPDIRLWVEDDGRPDGTPVLLIMGANASGLAWPEELVERLREHHRLVRYDHRDTGRSTWAFDQHPYALTDLAEDAIAVLDALDIDRAHVLGMSMGGILVQLLLLDHPDRLRSTTLFSTTALYVGPNAPELPGPDPRLLELWQQMADPRDLEAELDWRVEHWRILNGDVLDFDEGDFRAMELRQIEHAGRPENPAAHALADQSGLDRGADLAKVTVPTLVVEAPEDPINPPPHASHLANVIGGAQLVTIPGMGHALGRQVTGPLTDAILAHTTRADQAGGRGGSASRLASTS